MVARTSMLVAHGAAFLAVGFAVGLCARAAADFYDAGRASAPQTGPRDVYVVSPATEDSPAMLMWVAAELDEGASSSLHQTLGYRLETAADSMPRAQTVSSR